MGDIIAGGGLIDGDPIPDTGGEADGRWCWVGIPPTYPPADMDDGDGGGSWYGNWLTNVGA